MHHSMLYIGKFFSNFKEFYSEINTATLTGAIDVIVVEQPDGTYNCSPFHVRFGKLGVLRSREKVVDIEINGEPQDIHMKLGDSGEAFFVEELEDDENVEEIPEHLATSPIPVGEFETLFTAAVAAATQGGRHRRRRSFDLTTPTTIETTTTTVTETTTTTNNNLIVIENELNDYTKRRNTADNANVKTHEHDFIKRQIGLGNIIGGGGVGGIIGEANRSSSDNIFKMDSLDDIDSILTTGKSDNVVGCSTDVPSPPPPTTLQQPQSLSSSSLIVKLDQLSEGGRGGEGGGTAAAAAASNVGGSKKKRRKMKKKNAPRKTLAASSNIQNPIASSSSVDCVDGKNDTSTDPSSVESNISETDAKEIQKLEAVATANSTAASAATSTLVSTPSSTRKIIHDPDFHFFSDTELTTNNNTTDSRADSPIHRNIESVQSDSEFEVMKNRNSNKDVDYKNKDGGGQSWEWGGFPNNNNTINTTTPTKTTTTTNSNITNIEQQNSSNSSNNNQSSMLSTMFSFMKRNHGQNDGIYLSDINSIDPEVAALYFSKQKTKNKQLNDTKDDGSGVTNNMMIQDGESSGNGPSLAQSPNNSAGEGCKSVDSDFDEQIKGSPPPPPSHLYPSNDDDDVDIVMSLCGWDDLLDNDDDDEGGNSRFAANIVQFSDFSNNPSMLLDDPNLVVQIHGKYYNWKVAAPILASLIVFNRPLLQSTVDQLCLMHMPAVVCKTNLLKASSSSATAISNIKKQQQQQQQQQQQEGRYSWWSWRRSKSTREDTTSTLISPPPPLHDLDNVTGKDEEEEIEKELSSLVEFDAVDEKVVAAPPQQAVDDEDAKLLLLDGGDELNAPLPPPESPPPSSQSEQQQQSDKCRRKTLRLSSKQIVSLNLRDGMNQIEFSVTTAYQGTSRCMCHLYKWKWDDKIVISDIDGTITKSDVLGHILPIVGRDWAQTGVAQLFNKIKDNGYKLLYLSARAIGQARITREYLKSIKQGDLSMPDGPILLNPTSLITAFHREVIEKKPEQFKISCMSDIKALFPIDSNPFYAGYGNRINDVWAYRAVGIPIVRIFTINPKGELKHELTQTFQSTYSGQSLVVNDVFPPINSIVDKEFISNDDDNDKMMMIKKDNDDFSLNNNSCGSNSTSSSEEIDFYLESSSSMTR